MQTEYKIASGFTAWGLARKVNKLLAQGYELQGGVCRTWGGYFQAATKCE